MHSAQVNQKLGSPDSEHRPDSRLSSKVSLLESSSLDKVPSVRSSSDEFSRSNLSFTSISTALSFANFVTGLHDAPSEIRSLVTIIQRVQEDVERALRLRSSPAVRNYCAERLEDKRWIYNALSDAQRALDDVGRYVENVRVTGSSENGSAVKMRSKFDWVLRHHRRLRDRKTTLLFCHQSLSTVINLMQNLQMAEMGALLEGQSGLPMFQTLGLPSRPSKRHDDATQSVPGTTILRDTAPGNFNFSTPSITVSEMSEEQLGARLGPGRGMIKVDPLNTDPIELPGSAPQVVSSADNVDLYSFPPKPTISLFKSASLPEVSETILTLQNVSPGDGNLQQTPVTPPTEFPQLAKRYRARAQPVQIPSPRGRRHRSLSRTLPYIPQTTSFVSEFTHLFSDHVDTLFHGRAADTPDTLPETQPQSSGHSSPLPEQSGRTQAPIASAPSAVTPPSMRLSFQGTRERSTTEPPTTTLPAIRRKEVLALVMTNMEIADASNPAQPGHQDGEPLPRSPPPQSEYGISSSSPEQPALECSFNRASLQDSRATDTKREEEVLSSEPNTSHQDLASASSTTTGSVAEERPPASNAMPDEQQRTSSALSSQTMPAPISPTSSRARRRRAHQRRMQAAYGREED